MGCRWVEAARDMQAEAASHQEALDSHGVITPRA
jgi:hypothetical protein